MKIVGYHAALDESGQCIIGDSDGDLCRESPYLGFLIRDKGECIKVFYHLNMAVACLCKAFGFTEYQCRKLFESNQLYYQAYTYKYISGKFFSIRYGRHGEFVNFSDASQYEDWRLEPNSNEENVIAKAKDAQRVGQAVYDALRQLDLHPVSLTSPIRAFYKEVLSKMDLPTHDDIPEGASELAYACCRGGWTEAFQKGNFEAWDYDIVSAYPAQIAKLVDIRPDCGYWKYSKEYIPDAFYGYCRGKITIVGRFSPILYNPNDETAYPDLSSRLEADLRQRNRDLPIYTPTGTFPTIRHKKEIDFIIKYGIGDFVLQDGWYFIPKKIVRPLKDTVEFLHAKKEQATGKAREVLKRVPQGLYGLLLQIHERDEDPMGDLFNSIWGAEVENTARLEVARFVIENDLVDNLLHIATDGVLSSKPAPYTNEPTMGSWKLSSHGPAMVISSGVAAVKGKEATSEFSLGYDWLLDQIKQNPDASEYSLTKWSPISLGVAMLQNKFDKLGQLETLTKTIRIPYELKRSYKEKPRTGGELLARHYVSVPRDISQVAGTKGLMRDNNAIQNKE